MNRSDCFRLERPLAGQDSYLLGGTAFPRRTNASDLVPGGNFGSGWRTHSLNIGALRPDLTKNHTFRLNCWEHHPKITAEVAEVGMPAL